MDSLITVKVLLRIFLVVAFWICVSCGKRGRRKKPFAVLENATSLLATILFTFTGLIDQSPIINLLAV
jgi:hypothetical protein